MNRQIINGIIKVSIDEPKVYYVIYTRDKSYNCYEEIACSNDVIRFVDDDNHVEFNDDYDDKINLSYEDIIGIRIGDV